MEASFNVISLLAKSANNRARLCISGVCEVVIKGLNSHLDKPLVCEQGCHAICNLSTDHFENIGKLGANGACQSVSTALMNHPTHPIFVEYALKCICLLSIDPDIRCILGECAVQPIINAMHANLSLPAVSYHACAAVTAVIVGNAHNRNVIGQIGGCELVRAILEQHHQISDVSLMSCRAIHNLSAGSPLNAVKFRGIQQLLQYILSNPKMSDFAKKEANECLLRIK